MKIERRNYHTVYGQVKNCASTYDEITIYERSQKITKEAEVETSWEKGAKK